MIEVGVVGAAGRMGSEVVRAVDEADGLSLAAVIDPSLASGSNVVPTFRSMADVPEDLVDVIVDFTVAPVTSEHLAASLGRGIHAVVGTTGLTDEDLARASAASAAGGGNAVIAPNFAIGAVLAMRFARLAARYFDGVEIIELHHDRKVDAPSGTAVATARHIADARHEAGMGAPFDPTTSLTLPGARGGVGAGGIPIHSVRMPGLVAHEEIHFGNPGEGLVIRHDSYDRSSFMGGVVLAVRRVAMLPGITVGLEPLLEL